MSVEIAVPDPCLIVLVGVAGAGKTTFAARHFAAEEILTSDAFRALLGRDEADQDATPRAFAALHAALGRRLAAGRTTAVDATNVLPGARRALVRRAVAAGLPAVAIVLDLPLAECLAADRARDGRHVPVTIVERQWARLRATIDGSFAGEGFAAVHRLTSRSAVDSVVLRRGAASWPTLSPIPLPAAGSDV